MTEALALELDVALELVPPALVVLVGVLLARFRRLFRPVGAEIGIFKQLGRVGREIYRDRTLGHRWRRLRILSYGITDRAVLRRWFRANDNPRLVEARKRSPEIDCTIHWPYIHCDWPRARKLEVIDQHYRLAEGRAAVLGIVVWRDVVVARLDEQYPGLRIVLDRAPWFAREGEVVLNLFLDERRIFSVAFSLGLEGDQRVAYVGAIQGMRSPDALEIYRLLTRAMHGQRPRDLLMIALRYLLGAVGVDRIRAVSGSVRQHQSDFFAEPQRDKVMLDYDTVWTDQGGWPREDGFFEIPVVVHQRDLKEIQSRKRALYRRRYAMLEEIRRTIVATCTLHGTRSGARARDVAAS